MAERRARKAFTSGLASTGWKALEPMVWMGAIVCLAGYATLIPRYRLWGAVAATGIAFTFMLLLSYWQAQKLRPFPYEYRRMLIVIIAALVPVLLFRLASPSSLLTHLFWAAGLSLMYPLLIVLFGFMESDEKDVLRRLLKLAPA